MVNDFRKKSDVAAETATCILVRVSKGGGVKHILAQVFLYGIIWQPQQTSMSAVLLHQVQPCPCGNHNGLILGSFAKDHVKKIFSSHRRSGWHFNMNSGRSNAKCQQCNCIGYVYINKIDNRNYCDVCHHVGANRNTPIATAEHQWALAVELVRTSPSPPSISSPANPVTPEVRCRATNPPMLSPAKRRSSNSYDIAWDQAALQGLNACPAFPHTRVAPTLCGNGSTEPGAAVADQVGATQTYPVSLMGATALWGPGAAGSSSLMPGEGQQQSYSTRLTSVETRLARLETAISARNVD